MSTPVSTQFTPGHIGLNVRDLARSKRFYQDVFGFDLAGESNDEGRISVSCPEQRDRSDTVAAN